MCLQKPSFLLFEKMKYLFIVVIKIIFKSSMMSKLTIRSEPLGTVLIIGSWNFPLSLTLQPLISAIAAGCTAIVKPSEVSVHTCRLLKELLPLYLDKVAFPVIYADGGQTAQLLKHHPFDLVFYTGSSRVGTGSFFHS